MTKKNAMAQHPYQWKVDYTMVDDQTLSLHCARLGIKAGPKDLLRSYLSFDHKDPAGSGCRKGVVFPSAARLMGLMGTNNRGTLRDRQKVLLNCGVIEFLDRKGGHGRSAMVAIRYDLLLDKPASELMFDPNVHRAAANVDHTGSTGMESDRGITKSLKQQRESNNSTGEASNASPQQAAPRLPFQEFKKWVAEINEAAEIQTVSTGKKTQGIVERLRADGHSVGLTDDQILDSICKTARDWHKIEFIWTEARDDPDHGRYGDYCGFRLWLVQDKITEMASYAGYSKVIATIINRREQQKEKEEARQRLIEHHRDFLLSRLHFRCDRDVEADIAKADTRLTEWGIDVAALVTKAIQGGQKLHLERREGSELTGPTAMLYQPSTSSVPESYGLA